MSVHQVKIFLTDDAHAELMDKYLDKEDELRKFVFDQIKALAVISKMAKLQKTFIYNIEAEDENVKGRIIKKQDTMPLKDAKLEDFELDENPGWLPESLKDEEVVPYVYKVGTNTWEYLVMFCSMFNARVNLFNKSIKKDDPQRKTKLIDAPTCIEEVLHTNLINQVFGKVTEAAGEEFDKEDEKLNKEEKKQKKEPPPKAIQRTKKTKK